jgi:phosphate/sulfate permease
MINNIIFSLIFLSPIISISLICIIWKLLYKKQKEKILNKQKEISKRLKRTTVGSEKPFGELRYPAMILAVSSLIFTLLTFSFGIGYNRTTMQAEFFFAIDPSPDLINPMQQFPDYCWVIMFIGYYIAIIILIYIWFEYCKWRWLHWID